MTLVTTVATWLALLHGTVTLGPTSPVCAANTPCSRPAALVQLVFRSGKRVVRATTRMDGTYTVSLPGPGTYAVTANVGMRLEPTTVVARKGTHVLAFAIDTAIR